MDPKRIVDLTSSKKKVRIKDLSDDDFSGDLVVDVEMPISVNLNLTPKQKTAGKSATSNTSNKKRRKRDSASSDEERWLTAIESGKLEDVDDELKKIKPKDPALMTARQRAMYDRGADGGAVVTPQLMSLPTGYKEKVMTAEAIQKAALKSIKRKQLADEKREKDKKKTMERLLKKQESKALKSTKMKSNKTNAPVILYKQNIDCTFIAFPINLDYPIKEEKIKLPPKVQYCSMKCGNLKKYACSKTGAALCSLICYKKNISSIIF